jgi:hypothetical protein
MIDWCSVILESDAGIITSRVSLRGAENDLPLSEQVCLAHQSATNS